MSSTAIESEFASELAQNEADTGQLGFDFELHYDLHGKSLQDIFGEILHDSSSSKHIHNWDKKLLPSPVHAIARVGAKYLREKAYGILVTHSAVEEVLPASWTIHDSTDVRFLDDIDSRLFFAKKAPKQNKDDAGPVETVNGRPGGAVPLQALNFAQGRVIYIKEQLSYPERAALLMLYTFCIRLQDEDYRYIHAFIERHLSLRCELKLPYHWQETSPPQLDTSLLMCYKRVTLSCHISYLTLNLGDEDEGEDKSEKLDRMALFPFRENTGSTKSFTPPLFKASVSVLLTLAVPEKSMTRKEQVELLSTPQALWTVLVVNASSTFLASAEPRQHLTPIAQFVRGVASSLHTQQVNARMIHDLLRDTLNTSDDGTIFDDDNFTKSILYHCAIKTCDALSESLASSLRFIQGMLNSKLEKLCSEAHDQEKIGVDHWVQQLQKETFGLEDLHAQILAMKSQVQESRNALHGVTAVLESRLASQQGKQMKTLAYLATVYIPLTASTAIYSMSVLPESATFVSFFVVLIIFFVFTTALVFNLETLVTKLRRPNSSLVARFRLPGSALVTNIRLPGPLVDAAALFRMYIQGYRKMLNPHTDYKIPSLGMWNFPWWILRTSTIVILRSFLLPEINMPLDQYTMFRYRDNRFAGIRYIPWWGVLLNVARGTLIPVWIVLAVGIVCYQVLLDAILAFIFVLLSLGSLFRSK